MRLTTGLRLSDPVGPPSVDTDGRVRSIQAAELPGPREGSDDPCTSAGLERLGAAYWRHLARISLGLIRVRCTPAGACRIAFVGRPLVLLTFAAPTVAPGADGGSITWPITGGLLLSRDATGDPGVLRISATCTGGRDASARRLRVEVAVLGFRPSIADRFGRRVYEATQSPVHVFVTRGFLRAVYREIRRATSGASARPS